MMKTEAFNYDFENIFPSGFVQLINQFIAMIYISPGNKCIKHFVHQS